MSTSISSRWQTASNLVNAINGGDPRTSGEIFRTGRTSHVAHH